MSREILGVIIGLFVIFMVVWGLLILLGFNDKLSEKKQLIIGTILMFGAVGIAWTFTILYICL